MSKLNDYLNGLAARIRSGDETAVREIAVLFGLILRQMLLLSGVREDEAEARTGEAVYRLAQLIESSDLPGAMVFNTAMETALHRATSQHSDPDLIRRISQSLLGSSHRVPGLKIDIRSWPSLVIGGDLFTTQPMKKGRTLVALGDAVGHGFSAAIYAFYVLGALQARAAFAKSIEELIEVVNKLLHASVKDGHSVSLLLLEWRPSENNAKIVNAGMPKPLIIGTGSLQVVNASGTPLGWFEKTKTESKTVSLANGNDLLLFSDGFEGDIPRLEEIIRIYKLNGRLPEQLPPGSSGFDGEERDDCTMIVLSTKQP